MKEPSKLLVVVGPTATGKSELALRLAEKWGGEVVSADSVQVYRHFDIGSGKPTAEERARVPHHLLDVADPLQPMEANVWADLARKTIDDVRARGRVPIVCGGTFLWVRALLFGLAEAPPADATIRARHQEEALAQGRESLHHRLQVVDPASAARLHPNDLVRVSRALEVFETSGKLLSEIQSAHGFREPLYRATLVSVGLPLSAYEERLANRVRQMIASGLRQEVTDLLERGYGSARAMDAVGYRQVKNAVLDTSRATTDSELARQVIQVTRVFARRQRTWLRDEPVTYVPPETLTHEDALDQAAQSLANHLEDAAS